MVGGRGRTRDACAATAGVRRRREGGAPCLFEPARDFSCRCALRASAIDDRSASESGPSHAIFIAPSLALPPRVGSHVAARRGPTRGRRPKRARGGRTRGGRGASDARAREVGCEPARAESSERASAHYHYFPFPRARASSASARRARCDARRSSILAAVAPPTRGTAPRASHRARRASARPSRAVSRRLAPRERARALRASSPRE